MIVNETDDGYAAFARVARGIAPAGRVAIGDRVWTETTINLAGLVGVDRLEIGSHLVNGLRRVKDADELAAMGRAIATVEKAMEHVTPLTVAGVSMAELVEEVEHGHAARGLSLPVVHDAHVHRLRARRPRLGDRDGLGARSPRAPRSCSTSAGSSTATAPTSAAPSTSASPRRYREMYAAVLAAQDAGRRACVPGALARDVNSGCRRPLEEAGWGEHFRHRMGHGIGMDVHEPPFLSSEDTTPLEAGMTFSDEPSIFIDGRVGLRIEDLIVCEDGEGRMLNSYSRDLVTT